VSSVTLRAKLRVFSTGFPLGAYGEGDGPLLPQLRAAGHPELGMLEICRRDEDFPVGVTGKVLKRHLRETYGDLDGRVRERGTADVATAF
jgi:hypothetical protein